MLSRVLSSPPGSLYVWKLITTWALRRPSLLESTVHPLRVRLWICITTRSNRGRARVCSLAYGERRIQETYAYPNYVLWDQIGWWKAIPLLPNLFPDKEDTFQNHLLRLWEEEDLTAMTNYCLKLDPEAGKSPLARYEAPEYTLSRSRRMLGSMDPLLLAACVRGTVASLAETEGDPVRKELQVIAARDDVSPGTYANFFTDHTGMAITPAQLQLVVRNM